MKQQSSSKREKLSEFFLELSVEQDKQEGPSEPTELTFLDDDEPLSLEDTAFVTRGHLPEDLHREFESDMELISSLEEDPDADNR